jgi:hypothetical protein
MPFTPFHFGPHATIGLTFNKYIDLPVFILANVAIDLEPLAVLTFDLHYPVHGYCHTFLFGTLAGLIWAFIAYHLRGVFGYFMGLFRLPYTTSISKITISAVLGFWTHILLDGPIYVDIKPFFPSSLNPLFGIVYEFTDYVICTIFFVPALILYFYRASLFRKKS